MRIGSPSLESVLIAANVAVALCLGVLYVAPELRDGPPPTDDVLGEQRRGPLVVIVVAEDRPVDAAVGHSAAQALGGLVLTVPPDGPSDEVQAELSTASPDRTLVLGGPSAVSDSAVRRLEGVTSGRVTRVSGGDRFQTAAALATSQFLPPVAAVRIASGDGDAVAAPASAGDEGRAAPLLLVHGDRIPASVLAALRQLQPRRIEVLGGQSAVSDAVVAQLQQYTPGDVTRVATAS
jgi:putative cell wall-binding protein